MCLNPMCLNLGLLFVLLLAVSSGQAQNLASGLNRDTGLAPDYPKTREVVDVKAFPWQAIGQLNMAGQGSCTATLVSENQIVTAAHCLWNKNTGRWYPPEYIHFVAGFEGDSYRGHSLAKAVQVSPLFQPGEPPTQQRAGHDWAIITLVLPLGKTLGYLPVATSRQVHASGKGLHWTQVGYRADRAYRMTAHHACELVPAQPPLAGLLFHRCDTTHGDSGGPLLLRQDDHYSIGGIYVGRRDEDNLGVVITPERWSPPRQ